MGTHLQQRPERARSAESNATAPALADGGTGAVSRPARLQSQEIVGALGQRGATAEPAVQNSEAPGAAQAAQTEQAPAAVGAAAPARAPDETAPHLQRVPLPTLQNPQAPGGAQNPQAAQAAQAPAPVAQPTATRGRGAGGAAATPAAEVDPNTRTASYRREPADFSGLAEVRDFARSLAVRQAEALTSQGAATLRHARGELQDAVGQEAERTSLADAGFRPGRRPARGQRGPSDAVRRHARQQASAARDAVPTDPEQLRAAIEARAMEDLQRRWASAIRGRLGRERANGNIQRFAQYWMSEEQERILVSVDRRRDGEARLGGYTGYLRPGAGELARIERDSRARHAGPDVQWRGPDEERSFTRYTETYQAQNRDGQTVTRQRMFGFGETLPLHPDARGGGRVSEYTNRVVPLIRAAWNGPWRADTYSGHGAGAWQGAGLCLDFYVDETRRDDRGFFNAELVMQLLAAIEAASRQIGGDWQGCYDDHRVLHAVRERYGANKVVYVNDAAANNHGPLLLHVHVDLLPPGQGGRPPLPGAGAAEVRPRA